MKKTRHTRRENIRGYDDVRRVYRGKDTENEHGRSCVWCPDQAGHLITAVVTIPPDQARQPVTRARRGHGRAPPGQGRRRHRGRRRRRRRRRRRVLGGGGRGEGLVVRSHRHAARAGESSRRGLRFVSSRPVSSRLVSSRLVSSRLVSFCFVSFRFIPFETAQ